jgi:peptidoglycan pentaglycine glycine transferase (the first glycine)
MKLVEISDRVAWDGFVAAHAWGHPLQLWGWGEAKRGNRWTPHRLVLADRDAAGGGGGDLGADGEWVAGAQVLLWPIPRTGRFIAYVPRGPVAEPGSAAARELMEQLVAWAKAHRVLYVRVEPAWTEADLGSAKGALGKGWLHARHHLQLSATYTIDLRKDEAALLEPMSHKHRQYIRKSERDGVSEYYAALHQELGERSYVYYAHYQGQVVAFLWLAAAGRSAYELYGGVDETGQAMKANYVLKWRAMADMKAAGYEIYDFNGRLNEGVSRFKEGFGPDETDYIGTWDYPLNRAGYHVWEHLWPVVKVVGRRVAGLRRGQ